jgi:hypothetical protein
MKTCFNGIDIKLDSTDKIEELLSRIAAMDNLELWLTADDGQSMCALINKSSGWLMYLRFPEDVGFSSRSNSLPENDEKQLPFRLSNGQIDYYPASWTLERSTIFSAISEFAKTGMSPQFIDWHDDSS